MKEIIKISANFVNDFHDVLVSLSKRFGLQLTDKDLHFWIIGIIGIFTFLIINLVFKWAAKWSITSISFIYTFTVLLVLVFAIEIQQKITNRGNMEFEDAVIGLWGFIAFFLVYVAIRLTFYFIKRLMTRKNSKERTTRSQRF